MSGFDKTCEHCGSGFHTPRPEQRFCNHSCWSKARVGPANSNWRGGKQSHPLYETYMDMVARCSRPSHPRYHDYGGRGITVCQEWRDDFWAYVADVGPRPAPGMSVDRENNDGNYEPSNVRWATGSQQAKNRRPSAYSGVTHDRTTGRFVAVRRAS